MGMNEPPGHRSGGLRRHRQQDIGGFHLAARDLLDLEGALRRRAALAPADARSLGRRAAKLFGQPFRCYSKLIKFVK